MSETLIYASILGLYCLLSWFLYGRLHRIQYTNRFLFALLVYFAGTFYLFELISYADDALHKNRVFPEPVHPGSGVISLLGTCYLIAIINTVLVIIRRKRKPHIKH